MKIFSNHHLIAAAMVLCCLTTYAQVTQVVEGIVLDANSKKALANVNIELPTTGESFVSNGSGEFAFEFQWSQIINQPGLPPGPKLGNSRADYDTPIMIFSYGNGTDTVSISPDVNYYEVILPGTTSQATGIEYAGHAKVADMHYHVSLKSYNEGGVELKSQIEAGAVDPLLAWQRNEKKLEKQYSGKWVRPKNKSNKLYQFTQATFPHVNEGNVMLAFNSISPLEHNLADGSWLRIFSKLFKTNGSFPWLKTIGDTSELTHWENFNNDYKFITSQQKDHNGLTWQFLESGNDLATYPDKHFVVNVIEGAHALQHRNFPHKNFDKPEVWVEHLARRDGQIPRLVTEETTRLAALGKTPKANRIRRRIGETPAAIAYASDLMNQEIIDNVDSLKELNPPVYMITVGHLSFNGMLDHAPALDANGIGKVFIKRTYRIKVSDYREFVNQWKVLFFTKPGVTRFGKTLFEKLLSKDNGHRIFIDLKHTGYSARKYFYDSVMVKNPNDHIPPIFSHGAANGLSEVYYSPLVDEYALLDSKATKVLYPFGINLYNEEIARICQNDGIIGITLEQRVLGGYIDAKKRCKEIFNDLDSLKEANDPKVLAAFNDIKTKITSSDDEAMDILREDYWSLEPFMQNLFHFIDHSTKSYADAWQHFCLGSDLDGLIDPIDITPTASQYPYMRNRLKQFIPTFIELRKKKGHSPNDESDYFDGSFSIHDALDALFYDSLRDFTQKNFKK